MNNKEFIAKLSDQTGLDTKATQKLVNQTIDELATLLDDGNDVLIHGFGTFEVKFKKERVITNPSSMKKMLVPPKLSLNFRLSETAKTKLK